MLFLILNQYRLKKAITIFILSLLFFSQVGYRFIYLIQQHQLKEEAEEQLLSSLHNDQLELINETANQQDIEWEEKDKEFYLHGQLYDVAKKEIVNGKTILYCLNDKKEEQLLNDLAKTIKANADNNSANKDGKQTIKLQLSDFTILTTNSLSNNLFVVQQYPELTVSIYTVIKKVITPPPNNNLYFQNLIL